MCHERKSGVVDRSRKKEEDTGMISHEEFTNPNAQAHSGAGWESGG